MGSLAPTGGFEGRKEISVLVTGFGVRYPPKTFLNPLLS